jgi:DNA-binding LytR/AlgR family response regulator
MFLNSENIICFVSSHDEIVFKAIHYNPFRFIRKYKIEEEMQEALETLYKKYTDSQKTIVLNSRDGAKSIRLKDLHFVESKNHYVLFHCEQEVIEVRGRLAEYDEELESHYFLRSGVSYLINCDYIKIFHRTKITLQNGKEISIGRKWKDQAQKGYMKYITEKADGRVWCDS